MIGSFLVVDEISKMYCCTTVLLEKMSCFYLHSPYFHDPYLNLDPSYPEQDADEFTFPMGAKKTWGRLELAFFIIGGCHKMWTTFGAPGGLQLSLKETEYDDPNTMAAGTRTRNPYNSTGGVCKTAPEFCMRARAHVSSQPNLPGILSETKEKKSCV
uniref:Uncharacterized protein n=1 Tax=Bubo bubo TaxID=30461 RepID=A0A8C0ICF4_BUBBB